MTILQAVAVVVLWRSRHFDTLDISRALGGVSEADVCRVLDIVRNRERGVTDGAA
jgi:hypothetical protein